MLAVITKNLFVKPQKITLEKALRIIESQDPIMCSDWHFLKSINREQSEAAYMKQKEKEAKLFKLITDSVKPRKAIFFLGDLSEEEIYNADDIKELYEIVSKIPGSPKIMIRGNNDIFDDDFYYTMGFHYVATEKEIVSEKLKIIFSHEPVSIKDKKLPVEDWVNVHGHSHGSLTLYNMPPEEAFTHLDVYHELWNQGINPLSWYMHNFRAHPEKYKNEVIIKYGWT